jgi:tRNA A-37 threonylcarbamoyl transferase component Bud32
MNAPTLSPADLRAADFDLVLPLQVQLPWRDGRFVADRRLRLLPGRRVVLAGAWYSGATSCRAVVKFFFRDADYRAELRGLDALAQAGLRAPLVLARVAAAGIGIVALAELQGATLYTHWLRADIPGKYALMRAAVRVVAAMHRQGVVQTDIHLDNFFVSNPAASAPSGPAPHSAEPAALPADIAILDAGAISACPVPLADAQAAENLAWLLAQVPSRFDADVDAQVAVYNAVAGRQLATADISARMAAVRVRRWQHYRKKLTRTCTEFCTARRFNRLQVWRREGDGPELRELLAHPDQWMQRGEMLKDGNSATVVRVVVDGRPLVIKRYNLKSPGHRLRRCWRQTRAWNSWHNAHRLLFEGLLTPQPVALIEERCGPLRGRAWFVAEYQSGEDLLTLHRRHAPADQPWLDAEVTDLFNGLARARLSHGDMKATNLLVTDKGLVVIDLDAMQMHSSQAACAQRLAQDRERFVRNWEGELAEHYRQLFEVPRNV